MNVNYFFEHLDRSEALETFFQDKVDSLRGVQGDLKVIFSSEKLGYKVKITHHEGHQFKHYEAEHADIHQAVNSVIKHLKVERTKHYR